MIQRVLTVTSRSVEETRIIGACLAPTLLPGDVISLSGDLGAGKTAFVQGAARALGVQDHVTSPTFVLVREYRGEVPVHHVDVYRLDRIQEVLDLGFEDLLDPSGVVFVEWGSAIEALLPDSPLEIRLTVSDEDEARRLDVLGRGSAWGPRWDGLEERLGSWRAA